MDTELYMQLEEAIHDYRSHLTVAPHDAYLNIQAFVHWFITEYLPVKSEEVTLAQEVA